MDAVESSVKKNVFKHVYNHIVSVITFKVVKKILKFNVLQYLFLKIGLDSKVIFVLLIILV
jgi:hypothetical protein